MDLAALTTIWNSLRQQLVEQLLDADGEDLLDTEVLFDTLDGELDLADRLRSLIRKRRHLLADADALKGMIREMTERKLRLEKAADSIANAVVHAMSEAGIRKLSSPDFTVSLGQGKPPLAGADKVDLTQLPAHLLRTTVELDRSALREALEKGERVEGCYLGNPSPHLIVRKT
jgi:hypothetical protein